MPPSRQLSGHAHVVEEDLGGVRCADAVLLELRALAQSGRVRRHDERRLTARAERRIDGRDDDVHVGDATVRDPCLLAVEDPLVLRLVVDGARLHAGDVGTGIGLGDAERAELHLLRGAVALRRPLADLLRRAVAG